jgi:hypothetical protein
MAPEIGMRELIILVLCLVIYVTAVEVYEARVDVARQGQLVEQEQSFNYTPPSPPASDEGSTIVFNEIPDSD